MYLELIDPNIPRVIPDVYSGSLTHEAVPRSPQTLVQLDPFSKAYMFDAKIVGTETSNEVRSLLLNTTPVYIRGPLCAHELERFLNVPMPYNRCIRDVVRHLRIYLRCETFLPDSTRIQCQVPPVLYGNETRNHGEHFTYETYRSNLVNLDSLPHEKRKINVEICVFHNVRSKDTRIKWNLLEAVKSTYFTIKAAGSNVTVRYENFDTGEGSDVSWELDLDAELWEQVRLTRHPAMNMTHSCLLASKAHLPLR